MGTRGSIGVKIGEKLFASYVHFDTYPEGLGMDVVEFCRNLKDSDIDVLIERFKHIKLVTEEDIPSVEEQKYYMKKGFFNGSVGDKSSEKWYCLLRNLQGVEHLVAIMNGDCQHWIDNVEFLKDSLFCEYAYILDLNNRCLEFYEGFNKKPDENSPLPFSQICYRDNDKYKDLENRFYPVRFKGKASFNNIPKDWIKKFYSDKTIKC